jgi:HEAT repeat protein
VIHVPAAPPAPADTVPRAIQLIVDASVGESPSLRCNAVETMQMLPHRALPVVSKALGDANPAVRFAAVITAAKLKYKDLAPAIEPLIKDENPSVRAAAIFGLYTLGQKVDLTPLSDLLRSPEPSLRSNVAMLLGLLGDKSAVPMLKSAAEVPMPRASAAQIAVTRVQIAEAIAKLGDDKSPRRSAELDALRAGIYNMNFDEVRILAVNAVGEVQDRGVEGSLERLLTEGPFELQLAAAASLRRLGNPRGLSIAIQYSAHESAPVRAQAAWALGWFNGKLSYNHLARLLNDTDPHVRVAAAASIIRRTRNQE